MDLFSSRFVGLSFSEPVLFCVFGIVAQAILSGRAFVSFAFILVLCLSRALPLCFSLYVIDHFLYSEQRVYINTWNLFHLLHQIVPLANLMKGIPYPPSLIPLLGGRGGGRWWWFVKQFDSAFFHVVFQMDIIVLFVICSSIILTLPQTSDPTRPQMLAGMIFVYLAAFYVLTSFPSFLWLSFRHR